MGEPLSIYLHIPFCTARCGYCDFNTYAGHEHLIPSYSRALAQEARLWAGSASPRHCASGCCIQKSQSSGVA